MNRNDSETVALANADYEQRKLDGEKINVRMINREWKLKAGRLANFRANKNRRKESCITVSFKKK